VTKPGKNKEYLWYGKYEIVGKTTKLHQGEDKKERQIIVITLRKI
jgi:hypothetical protein